MILWKQKKKKKENRKGRLDIEQGQANNMIAATECSPSLRCRRPQGGSGPGSTSSSPPTMPCIYELETTESSQDISDEREAQVHI